jgi:hypothetical protein
MDMDRSSKLRSILLSILTIVFCIPANAEPQDWAVTIYHNVLSADPLGDLLVGRADYDHDYQLSAVALSKKIPTQDPRYDMEWEIQVAKHVQGQKHKELNGLVAARWYPLPWDNYIDTDIAAGIGLSYATEVPEFEAANHERAEQLMIYLLIELEFKPKSWDEWSVVLRSHHRSGAFGLLSGVHGASNSMGLGIKYRF